MKPGDETSPTRLLESEQAVVGLAGGDTSGEVGKDALPDRNAVPARAEGITLIGEFEQSGYEEAPSIVRRRDGQVVQLTELLYITLEAVDGHRNLEAIAAEVSERLQRTATPDNVEFLLEEKLRPLGLLKNPDGSEPVLKKSQPLLALRWKFAVSSERVTNRLTAPFAVLFRGPIVSLVLAAFVAACCWVLLIRGVAQGTRQALYSPGLLLMVFGLTVLSAGFHEFGHAAACRYGGGKPGVMGAGIYLVWPAFYTDVTDAYRLDRRGRLRTALGGLYFNAIFVLITFGAWAATSSEVFLLFVPIQLFQMLHQLLPVVRMDGYYILSDLTGVPDLFARIKPTLKSAIPGKATDERSAPLKRWVRVTVTAWVLVVVPLLLTTVVLAAIALPRLVATAWDSLGQRWDAIGTHADSGSWLGVASGVIAIGALLLPLAGSVYMIVRIARRTAGRAWAFTSGRPLVRTAAVVGTAGVVAMLAWTWWPNGDYQPITKSDKGTLSEGIASVREIDSGRPAIADEPDSGSSNSPTDDLPTPTTLPAQESEPADTTVAPARQLPTTVAPEPATTAVRPSTTVPRQATPTTVSEAP